METAIAVVTEISGEVYARAADGSLRSLQPGDQLFAGETLVTAESGQVVLDFGNGEVAEFGPNQALGMTEQMLGSTEPVPFDNQITDPSVAAVLAALDGEGDLLDDLEAPAAGTDGAPEGGGSSIVQLVRVFESIDPLAFSFDQEPVEPFEAPIGDQEGELLADADEPDLPETPNILPPELSLSSSHMVLAGATAITTARGMIDLENFEQGKTYNPEYNGNRIAPWQGLSKNVIEAELDLEPGSLNHFNPPGNGTVNHDSNVNVWDGKLTTSQVSMKEGTGIQFDWTFYNGEGKASQIESGKNDLVVLVITKPDGSKEIIQVSSSEELQAAMIGNGEFNYTADQDGTYRFDWLVLNGRDTSLDSALAISQPVFTLNGTDYFSQPVDLTISASLGSALPGESLTVEISGVPADAAFSAGTDLGGGVWSFTPAELEGLQFLPPVGFSGELALTVTASATLDGVTETASGDLTVRVDVTSNTVSDGSAGDDVLIGTDGNDLIHGYAGNDLIIGGPGNDILFGGLGADTFAWSLGDQGTVDAPAMDIVGDFTLGDYGVDAEADRLDLADLLSFDSLSDQITDFLSISLQGGDSVISVSHAGDGAITQSIVLKNVDLTTLGNSDAEIIESLISSGNLIVE
ncbi:Alkaline phosphatase [Nitrincola lacisaponensis]|uniref:Alkaline phosphatase n=1 Tax=Nitrincola lacisaponensis TaxID=267850 RepID=A0A063Y373_9GAMM|nr:retention module-containing protein [Nitrincola lacisaponensis]KDE39221.1 Alkaline phosphatase [Nitrincola lacisaponensis]